MTQTADEPTAAPRPEVTSLGALFLDCVRRLPDAEAFRHPCADTWASLTWQQTAQRARELAAGFLALGLQPEQRVAIAASTRLEWVLADLGVLLAGGATTTVYPNTHAADVAYILSDCEAVVVVAEDEEQVAKVRANRAQLPAVRAVVVIEPGPVRDGDEGWVMSLDDLAARGREHLAAHPSAVDDAVAGTGPDSLATLIYTSGTTGRPKGVQLTHANWLYIAEAIAAIEILRPDHLQFLWLPLSHVFGKLLLAGQLRVGLPTAIDGRIDKIVDNLAVIHPTFMAAAPRIFEKVHARVTSTAAAEGGAKEKIFGWAFRVGLECVRREQAGRGVPPHLAAQRAVADKLVFSKIRQRLGGRITHLVSGSAALSPQVAQWFAAAGLPIYEGYGLTEVAGAAFVNRPEALRIGSVGLALPGVEVRIAEDGEILLRTPGTMTGYKGLPDATAEMLLPDGWLATGDVGELDADGFLRITDRKKDLAKTSGGKYIAPSAIEGALKAVCPLLAHAVVIADNRSFASALLTLDPDTTTAWAQANGRDVRACLSGRDPELEAVVAAAVDGVNAGLNRWETVKQFRILPHELTVEAGELTPSLKVKRAIVAQHFADVIDDIYSPRSRHLP